MNGNGFRGWVSVGSSLNTFVNNLEGSTNGGIDYFFYILDATMGGLAGIGKGREITQGDLEGIGMENCNWERGCRQVFFVQRKNRSLKDRREIWERARSERDLELISPNQR